MRKSLKRRSFTSGATYPKNGKRFVRLGTANNSFSFFVIFWIAFWQVVRFPGLAMNKVIVVYNFDFIGICLICV